MKVTNPIWVSKWLCIAYAIAVLLFLLSNADSWDVVFFALFSLAWLVGPAGIAAMGSRSVTSVTAAWIFVAAQILIVLSTGWVWFQLFFSFPDAQNGIAAMLSTLVQYAGIFACYIVMALAGCSFRPLRSRIDAE